MASLHLAAGLSLTLLCEGGSGHVLGFVEPIDLVLQFLCGFYPLLSIFSELTLFHVGLPFWHPFTNKI